MDFDANALASINSTQYGFNMIGCSESLLESKDTAITWSQGLRLYCFPLSLLQ